MKRLIILIFALNVYSINAQLQTSGATSPTQIAHDILSGYATTISNVNYIGSENAIGTFNAVNTTLGIDRGVIITTGTISADSTGPYGPNDRSSAGMDNLEFGYAPLTSLIGVQTYNAAVLECDFVASSDSLIIEYIFGSEEYPEFVNSQFNDGFVFLISGPGIIDTINMATVVSINTVNNINFGTLNNGPCTNCEYYVINGDGETEPYNMDEQYIQYDGYTTPLSAFSEVQPGETYHLTIAIADAGDEIYDSGLFLKTNNLLASLPKHDKSKQIKVYPNPNKGTFFISDIEEDKISDVQVIGADGRKVSFDLEKINKSGLKIKISKASLGIYWIKCLTEKGEFYSSKFVVE